MSKKIFIIVSSKKCVYLDRCIQYAGMIHLSEYVKLSELNTQQVIVKSYGQHNYLEVMKSSQPEYIQTQHFRLKFMPQTLYFHVFR